MTQPADDREASERQPREHDVPCQTCREPTWAVDAVCDRCTTDQMDHALTRRLGLVVQL